MLHFQGALAGQGQTAAFQQQRQCGGIKTPHGSGIQHHGTSAATGNLAAQLRQQGRGLVAIQIGGQRNHAHWALAALAGMALRLARVWIRPSMPVLFSSSANWVR